MALRGWLGIDYGERRVGVAVATTDELRPEALVTLANNDSLYNELHSLCDTYMVQTLVIGLPRGLDGQETRQTGTVREAAAKIGKALNLEVVLQDEAVTSELAKERLEARGASTKDGAIDREAAAIILSDYLEAQI